MLSSIPTILWYVALALQLFAVELTRRVLANASTSGHYPRRYRKLHVGILKYAFETAEHTIRSITTYLKEYEPTMVQIEIPISYGEEQVYVTGQKLQLSLDEYERKAHRYTPAYLQPRLKAIIAAFRHWSIRARRPAASGPTRFAIGSLKMAEHSFRFGGLDAVVIVLLQQVTPISISTGNRSQSNHGVNAFSRRGAKAKSSYDVVSSLTFTR